MPPLEILLRFRPVRARDLLAPFLAGLAPLLAAAWTADSGTAGLTILLLLALWRGGTDLVRVRALFRGGAGEEILLAGWDPGQVAEGAGWLVARRVALTTAAAAVPIAAVALTTAATGVQGAAVLPIALAFPLLAGGAALVATLMTTLHLQKVALVTVEAGGSSTSLEDLVGPLRRRVLASPLAAQPFLYRALAVALSPTRWRLHLPLLETAVAVGALLLLAPWLWAGDREEALGAALGAALLVLWRSAARVLRIEGDLHAQQMREVLLSTGLSPRDLSTGAVSASLAPSLAEAGLLAAGLALLAPEREPLALLNVLLAPLAGALAAGATGAGNDRSRDVTVLHAVLPTVFAWLVALSVALPAAQALATDPGLLFVGSLTLALGLTALVSLARLGRPAQVEARRASVLIAVSLLAGALASLDLNHLPYGYWVGYWLPSLGVLCACGLAAFLLARFGLGPLVLRLAGSPPSPFFAMLLGAALGRVGAWVAGTAQVPWHLGFVSGLMHELGPVPAHAAGLLPLLAGALAAAVLQARWRAEGPPPPWRVGSLALRMGLTAALLALGLHLVATLGLPDPIAPAVEPPALAGTPAQRVQDTMQEIAQAAFRWQAAAPGNAAWTWRQRVQELRLRLRDEAADAVVGEVDSDSPFWTHEPEALALELWANGQGDLGAELLAVSLRLQEEALGFRPGQDLLALRESEAWSALLAAVAEARVTEPAALRRLVRDLPDGRRSKARLLQTLDAERAKVARGEASGADLDARPPDLLAPPLPQPLREALLERDRRLAGANLAQAARMWPILLLSGAREALLRDYGEGLWTPASRPLNGWGLAAVVESWQAYRRRVETLRLLAALQLHQAERLGYPERLEGLVPDYLPGLPQGEWTYRLQDGGGCRLDLTDLTPLEVLLR